MVFNARNANYDEGRSCSTNDWKTDIGSKKTSTEFPKKSKTHCEHLLTIGVDAGARAIEGMATAV